MLNFSDKNIGPDFMEPKLKFFLFKKLYYKNIISLEKYTQADIGIVFQIVNRERKLYFMTIGKVLLMYLLYISRIFKVPKQNFNHRINLVYGLSRNQIFQDGKVDSLGKFLDNLFVYDEHNLIHVIESNNFNALKVKVGSILLSANIDLFLFVNLLTFKKKIKLMILITSNIISYICYSFKYNYLIYIWNEFIFQISLYKMIENQVSDRILNLSTTTSQYRSIPYIFEFFQNSINSYMFWYSANSVPIRYKNQKIKRVPFHSDIFRILPIGNHLVWTNDHAKYLRTIVPKQVNVIVCGSLMFYPKENRQSHKIYDITIFDVSPYNPSKIDDISNLPINLNSIYSEEYVIQFINDILEDWNF